MQQAHPDAAAGRHPWHGPDITNDRNWLVTLTRPELDEIDAALHVFKKSGRSVALMTRAEFPLKACAQSLAVHLHEIRAGRGFVVLRGLPVAKYSDEDVGAIFYGMGLYLGNPVKQNPKGDLLGHVFDQGRKYGQIDVRGYETNAYLPFHTDGCEIVGLLCLRPAKAGGLSSITSAVAVHEEIAKTHPEYLEPLRRGYHYIRREAALTESPVSERRIPVLGEQDGIVSCRIVSNQIEAAAKKMETPLEGLDRKALDCFVELSGSKPLRLDMDLQQGDIQLINNYTTLHSRTGYEDFPEPNRRRHMLRLWLAFHDTWPLPEGFPRQLGYASDKPAEIHL
jgi:hypothetical protein